MIIVETDLTKIIELLKKYNYNPKRIFFKTVKKISETTYIYIMTINLSMLKIERSEFYKKVFDYYYSMVYNGDYLIRKTYPIGYVYDSNNYLIVAYFLTGKEALIRIKQLRRIFRKVHVNSECNFKKELEDILANTIELKLLKNINYGTN